MTMASSTAMAMATATSSSDMNMATSTTDMTMTTMMGMNEMAMTFFTSTSTPLYSMSWTPSSAGKYAGTCIFLIAFGTIFRALLAVRINFLEVLAVIKYGRKEGVVYPFSDEGKMSPRPWRANEAVILAAMDVALAGSSYLLLVEGVELKLEQIADFVTG